MGVDLHVYMEIPKMAIFLLQNGGSTYTFGRLKHNKIWYATCMYMCTYVFLVICSNKADETKKPRIFVRVFGFLKSEG